MQTGVWWLAEGLLNSLGVTDGSSAASADGRGAAEVACDETRAAGAGMTDEEECERKLRELAAAPGGAYLEADSAARDPLDVLILALPQFWETLDESLAGRRGQPLCWGHVLRSASQLSLLQRPSSRPRSATDTCEALIHLMDGFARQARQRHSDAVVYDYLRPFYEALSSQVRVLLDSGRMPHGDFKSVISNLLLKEGEAELDFCHRADSTMDRIEDAITFLNEQRQLASLGAGPRSTMARIFGDLARLHRARGGA